MLPESRWKCERNESYERGDASPLISFACFGILMNIRNYWSVYL